MACSMLCDDLSVLSVCGNAHKAFDNAQKETRIQQSISLVFNGIGVWHGF